jgi:cell pole-organizing protein PopZ
MEEILASIRQIISEDGDVQPNHRAESEMQASNRRSDAVQQPSGNREPQRSPAPAPVAPARPAEDDEQLEPAPQASAPPPPRPTQPEPPRAAQPAQPVQPPQPAAQVARAPVVADRPAKPAEERSLMSPNNGAVVHGAFSALAHTILAQNARTLEDLVAEMMRPMLKSWLDDNLPSLVERLVREEIERVSRGRR